MSDIESRVFFLRPLEKKDIPTVARWLGDPDDLSLFDRSMRLPLSPDAWEKMWTEEAVGADRHGKHWFAIENGSSQAVGVIGLESLTLINRDAIVPLYVDKANRGRGIGVRALALMLDIAFYQLGLNRLTSYCRADNRASRSLTERVGFREEGRMRDAWFVRGRQVDMVVIGILKQEWMERRTSLAAELDTGCVVSFGSPPSGSWVWPPSPDEAAL